MFRQLSYLYSLANWKAYFDNLGHKLPFLVTINYDFKLLTEDQKHSVYNTIKGIVKLQFTRQELELLWIQCGQPYVAEQYHRYLDRIWELYHHRLQNTDSSTQFGFLRSPFSRYRQSFEDSYGDKYCSELEGHIIVLQIDPLTLKPKIIDPIVLGPEDETLNVFLMPRGMGLLASKKSERNDC